MNSQLILAFTLTITSVNGVSVQKRDSDSSLSIRDSLDTKKAIALIGTVMTTSSSLDVFSNDKNTPSSALTKFFKGIDEVTLNALLVTAGLIITL